MTAAVSASLVMSGLPPWKEFVRGGDGGSNLEEAAVAQQRVPDVDARRAYEDIVGADLQLPGDGRPGGGEVPGRAPRPTPAAAPPAPRPAPHPVAQPVSRPTLSSLMRLAECDDCEGIREALELDSSLINSVDQFGWSLLMVAACAGSAKVAELLLCAGADTELRDKAGHSCRLLARKRGHHNIANLIKNFVPPSSKPSQPEPVEQGMSHPVEWQLCSVCKVSIDVNYKKSHLTSTVHQLSQCKKGCRTFFSIPGSNRGYQLMLKNGWDGETGLGPSGSGMKLPPKTTLKRDRKGLGASKPPARITHFQSNDYKAVAAKPPEHVRNKVKLNQQIRHDKLLEVSLRRELS